LNKFKSCLAPPYPEGDWTCVGRASLAGGELADKLGNIREAGQTCRPGVVETAAGLQSCKGHLSFVKMH